MTITLRTIQETSLFSWIEVLPLCGERQLQVFNVLARADRPLTAREVCFSLGKYDMNYVRPRITELYKLGRIRCAGTVFDALTHRTVMTWEVIKKM